MKRCWTLRTLKHLASVAVFIAPGSIAASDGSTVETSYALMASRTSVSPGLTSAGGHSSLLVVEENPQPCWWYDDPPDDCIDLTEYPAGGERQFDPDVTSTPMLPLGFRAYGSINGHSGTVMFVRVPATNTYVGVFVGSGGCVAMMSTDITNAQGDTIASGQRVELSAYFYNANSNCYSA